MTTHSPPDLVNTDNQTQHTGWSRISELISLRWPSWEPTPQDRSDWRHMLRNFDSTWLDEALLTVRSRYASDVPKLKWVLDAYYKVRDQQRQVKAPDLEEEKDVAHQVLKQQVEDDRRQCVEYLDSQPKHTLMDARDEAKRRFPFLVASEDEDHTRWGWVTRFAVKFVLEGCQ